MLATPSNLGAADWQREVEEMARWHPGFRSGVYRLPVPLYYWRGSLRPFKGNSDITQIIAHMGARQNIYVGSDGLLTPTGLVEGAPEITAKVNVKQRFTVEVVYLPKPAVPRIYALDPIIDERTYRDLVHLNHNQTSRSVARWHPEYRKARRPSCDLCVIAPQDGAWVWGRSTAADLIDQTALYLGALLIWQAIGRTKWPLPEAPHEPEAVLKETSPIQPCPCGSGKMFSNCHWSPYKAMVLGR